MQPKSLTAIHNQARNVRNQKVLTKLAYVKCVQVLKHSETEGHMNITRIPCIHKDTMVARAFTKLSNIARDPVVRPQKKKSKRKPTSQSRILLFYIKVNEPCTFKFFHCFSSTAYLVSMSNSPYKIPEFLLTNHFHFL